MSRLLTPTWGAASPTPGRGVDGLDHVPGEADDVLVDVVDGLRLPGQDRVADDEDLAKAICSFRLPFYPKTARPSKIGGLGGPTGSSRAFSSV